MVTLFANLQDVYKKIGWTDDIELTDEQSKLVRSLLKTLSWIEEDIANGVLVVKDNNDNIILRKE